MIENVSLSTGYIAKDSFLWNVFVYCGMRDGFFRMHTYAWDIDRLDNWKIEDLEKGSVSLYSNESKHALEAIANISPTLTAYLNVRQNNVRVTLAMREEGLLEISQALIWLQTLYPRTDPPTPTEVSMRFWTNTRNGANDVTRKLDVPSWDMIEQNYSQDTRTTITGIMTGFRPAHGGQLILWHGSPGTGKTFALRALGLSWRDWCTVECVIDPEAFFGDAAYMMQVLLDTEHYTPDSEEDDKSDPWRLLILEDAGELLAEDARERTGQGLSRLLNVADGLIGQGMRTLILVTTNEPLRRLHPAVARPGRCASEVEFKAFTQEEANTWLTGRGQVGESSSKGSQTLAQLYSKVDGFTTAHGADTGGVGFKR